LKGGILLSAVGYIQVRAFTSYAQIPIKDAAVTITDTNENVIAMRLTNRSGNFDRPIEINVPDLSAGQSPNTGVTPYATVNLYARAENFEEIEVKDVQVFPDTVTLQNLELIPLSELPGIWNKSEIFQTTPQNL
jgi:hypothetical protein